MTTIFPICDVCGSVKDVIVQDNLFNSAYRCMDHIGREATAPESIADYIDAQVLGQAQAFITGSMPVVVTPKLGEHSLTEQQMEVLKNQRYVPLSQLMEAGKAFDRAVWEGLDEETKNHKISMLEEFYSGPLGIPHKLDN